MSNQSHFERSPRSLRRRSDRRWWFRLGLDFFITRLLIVALMALTAGQLYRAGQHEPPVALNAATRAAEKALQSNASPKKDGAHLSAVDGGRSACPSCR